MLPSISSTSVTIAVMQTIDASADICGLCRLRLMCSVERDTAVTFNSSKYGVTAYVFLIAGNDFPTIQVISHQTSVLVIPDRLVQGSQQDRKLPRGAVEWRYVRVR